MKRNYAIIFLLLLVTLTLGCISSPETQTVTVEKTHVSTQTVTTTIIEKTTYTTTKMITTTTTVYTTPPEPEQATVYNVKITLYNGHKLSMIENNSTRIVYIPLSWSPIGNDIFNLYRFLDKKYLQSFAWELQQTFNMSEPPVNFALESYEPIASIMYFNFDYDSERTSKVHLVSYLPDELLTKRSGICGDFAMFYIAYLLAYSKTITYYVLSFDTGPGHAIVEYNGIIFENQFVGEDPKYVFNYWYHESGPYKLYALTIAPSGVIGFSSTSVTKYFKVPLTPIYLRDEVSISGEITYTFAGVIITQLNRLYLNDIYGEARTQLIVNGSTVNIIASYNQPDFYYSSGTNAMMTKVYSMDDSLILWYMVPGYYPFYDVFTAIGNTLYMLYWNDENQPVYYTVVVDGNILYITYTEYYNDIEILGTGFATYK